MEEFWSKWHKSVCKITHFKNGVAIGSGTGFKVNNYLITNHHVFYSNQTDQIEIRFVGEDSNSLEQEIILDYANFQTNLISGDSVTGWDFAIVEITDSGFKKIPSFSFSPEDFQVKVGMKICLLGFPFEQNSLTLHAGIISSLFSKNGVKYIQVDASVNRGNSGGPLIDYKTGKVIGIITRKGTGLTNMFDKVKDGILQSIDYLDQLGNVQANISGFDLMEATKVTQNQILTVFNEIERSANVGIGYAFRLDEIRKHLV